MKFFFFFNEFYCFIYLSNVSEYVTLKTVSKYIVEFVCITEYTSEIRCVHYELLFKSCKVSLDEYFINLTERQLPSLK